MAKFSAKVLATDSHLPRKEVTSEAVAELVGVTPEWIERKTQVRSRRYAAPDEATSDLAVRAGPNTLEQADTHIGRIGYAIVSTSTGDFPQPPTSYLVQNALKAYGAACFDIDVVCSGFVYGLALVRGLVLRPDTPDTHVPVGAAGLYSRILGCSDHRTAVFLGGRCWRGGRGLRAGTTWDHWRQSVEPRRRTPGPSASSRRRQAAELRGNRRGQRPLLSNGRPRDQGLRHRFPWHLTTPTGRACSRTATWYCSPGSAAACR